MDVQSVIFCLYMYSVLELAKSPNSMQIQYYFKPKSPKIWSLGKFGPAVHGLNTPGIMNVRNMMYEYMYCTVQDYGLYKYVYCTRTYTCTQEYDYKIYD